MDSVFKISVELVLLTWSLPMAQIKRFMINRAMMQ